MALDQTPRAPRPARQAAIVRSTSQAQAAPGSSSANQNVIEISDSDDGEAHPPPSVEQPSLPDTRASTAPPSQLGDAPASRANSVVNPLDLDDPVYRAPTPDTPEHIGRRYLLLDQPPPTPEFYERRNAASNDTDILAADRCFHRTLHPQFVFNRNERAEMFDRAFDDAARILRPLEFTTNADFLLIMSLPDESAPNDARHSRVFRSRTIDSSDYYHGISERIVGQFGFQIADTRRAEVQEWLEYAQWEADQRDEARARAIERAEREIQEQQQALAAAAAAAAAEQQAAAAAAAYNEPADESNAKRTSAKRPNDSPGKHSAPAKKRKDDDGHSNSGAEVPAKRRKPPASRVKASTSTGDKGKGKAKAVDPSVSTSQGAAGGSGGLAVGTSAGASNTDHHDPDTQFQAATDADADADADADTEADDPDLREALAASLKSVVTDEAKRLGQPVASSSNIRLDDVQPGEHNALAPRTNQPHRPEPILPTAVTLYLLQINVPSEFWPAIELVWTTRPPAEYPDAIAGVSARCLLGLTAADIYTLAALLSRTSPPRRS